MGKYCNLESGFSKSVYTIAVTFGLIFVNHFTTLTLKRRNCWRNARPLDEERLNKVKYKNSVVGGKSDGCLSSTFHP